MCGIVRFVFAAAFWLAEFCFAFVSLGSTYVVMQTAVGVPLATAAIGSVLTYVLTEALFFPEAYYGRRSNPFEQGSIASTVYAFIFLYSAAVPLGTAMLFVAGTLRFGPSAGTNSMLVFFVGAQMFGHLVWRTRRAAAHGDEAIERSVERQKEYAEKKKKVERKKASKGAVQRKCEELEEALLVVEGSMAVGKTTLCRKLERALERVRFHNEQVYDDKHEAFMTDPRKNAFRFQMAMREKRSATIDEALKQSDRVADLIDRSVVGDLAFALWNCVCGNITVEQFDEYFVESFWNDAFRAFTQPHSRAELLFVYAPAELCAERIRSRDTNDKHTELKYLRGVTIAHYISLCFVLARNNNKPVVLVNGQHEWAGESRAFFKKLVRECFLDQKNHAVSPYSDENSGQLTLDKDQIARLYHVAKALNMRSVYERMYGGDTLAVKQMEISEKQWFDEMRQRIV